MSLCDILLFSSSLSIYLNDTLAIWLKLRCRNNREGKCEQREGRQYAESKDFGVHMVYSGIARKKFLQRQRHAGA